MDHAASVEPKKGRASAQPFPVLGDTLREAGASRRWIQKAEDQMSAVLILDALLADVKRDADDAASTAKRRRNFFGDDPE